MKKTSLLSIALLLSAAIFAQTSVKNSEAINDNTSFQSNKNGSHVNSSASVSTHANILSEAGHKSKSKTYTEIPREKKAVATKIKTGAQAGSTAKESKKITSKEASLSGSAQTTTGANTSARASNIRSHTSFGNHKTVSTFRSGTNAHQIKGEGKSVAITKNNATMGNEHHEATAINKSTIKEGNEEKANSASVVRSETSSIQTIKPRPVSVKTSMLVRVNGGIKLK